MSIDIPAHEYEANSAETMQRNAARRAILEDRVIEYFHDQGKPRYGRQVALALDLTTAQASPLLRKLEKVGRLTSSMVPMAHTNGPGRRYFRIPEGS